MRMHKSLFQFLQRSVLLLLRYLWSLVLRLVKTMSNIKDEVFADYMATASSSPAEDQTGETTNLLVNYLPFDMLEGELYALFVSFGHIKHVKIIRDAETGASHCYGFVNFSAAGNANLAQVCLNGRQVRGKRLKVSPARPSSMDIRNAKVYVANLPIDYNEQKVRATFGRYGNILDLNVLKDRFTGLSRGIAFVRFDLKSSADMAISVMNGYTLEGGSFPLQVRLAKRPKAWEAPKPHRFVDRDQELTPNQVARPAKTLTKRNMPKKTSADISMDSGKEQSTQLKRPMAFRFGQNASSEASVSRPAPGGYNLLMNVNFGKGRSVLAVPRAATPMDPASKQPPCPAPSNGKSLDPILKPHSQPVIESSLDPPDTKMDNLLDDMKSMKNIPPSSHRIHYEFPLGLRRNDAPASKPRGFSFNCL
nr:polyadenylate-binding protein 1A isoform X1 [Drosophila virilis]